MKIKQSVTKLIAILLCAAMCVVALSAFAEATPAEAVPPVEDNASFPPIAVAVFDALPEETLYQGYDACELASQEDLGLPAALAATDAEGNAITVEGITWQSSPAFDPAQEAPWPGYVFTPALPEGYTLAEGTALPEITVFIRPEGGVKVVPLAVYDTVTVDGINYRITKMPTPPGETNGEVSVGNNTSFEGNANIPASITISDGDNAGTYAVTGIANDAFNGCTGLVSITIPSSVETIGDGAFFDCTSLASIALPGSVETIGISAFRGCIGLTSITLATGIKTIGVSAFYSCEGLTSITLPGSVETIGNYAFFDCKGLTSIALPGSVETIGISAFRGCTGLTSITLENGIKTIGDRAFFSCDNPGLTSITIPSSVTSIGSSAFNSCTGITDITFEGNTPPTTIDANAFSNLATIGGKVHFPASAAAAYSNILGLMGLSGGIAGWQAVTTLTVTYNTGDAHTMEAQITAALNALSPLTAADISKIIVTGDATAITGNDWSNLINLYCAVAASPGAAWTALSALDLSGMAGLRQIETDIGFPYTRAKLTELILPDSLEIIGNNAFRLSTNLVLTALPSGLKTIGANAFRGSENLALTTLPSGLTGIGASAFEGCAGLTSIAIPGGVETIDENAFRGCTGLTSIVLGDGVQTIGRNAFRNCNNPGLISVTIPSTVAAIGSGAFQDCTGLTSVTLEDGLKVIGELMFEGCTGLTSVTIPSTVESFNNQASFLNCTGLTSITFEEGLKGISRGMFWGCANLELTSIIIPGSVETIGSNAFDGCTYLSSITFEGDSPPTTIDALAFNNVSATGTVRYPKSAATAYEAWFTANAAALRNVADWDREAYDDIAPTLTPDNAERTGSTTAAATFTSDEDGEYYYGFVADGAAEPAIGTSGAGIVITAGADTTITLTGIPSDAARDLWVYVKDAAGNIGKLKIDIPAFINAETPSITAQPQDGSVEAGGSLSLSVTANVTDGGNLTYQWYSNETDSVAGGIPIEGAISATYTLLTDTAGTTYYYVIISNTNNDVNGAVTASVTSDTAKVIVNPIADAETPTITVQPQDGSVESGGSLSLSVTANVTDGGTLSYQWYSNETDSIAGGTPIAGAIYATYTPPTDTTGTVYYYVVVTNTNDGASGAKTATATSSAAAVTVTPVVYPVTLYFGTWSGSGTATVRVEAQRGSFLRLMLNGAEVSAASYTVTEGSTIITLREGYLKTLKNGTYIFRAEFTGGYADLTLSVNVKHDSIPKTGDSGNALLWLIASALPAIGLIALLWRKRRARV